jgi:chromate transporter
MRRARGHESGRIKELVQYFLRLGLLGFGGPVALVGQMERELKWDVRL